MNTRGSIRRYRKPSGVEEVCIHFPQWVLDDGHTIRDVTIFPHACNTCVGGDHMHVNMHDTREAVAIIAEDAVTLSPAHEHVINRFLKEKLALNTLTREFLTYITHA